jgi:hypothetical protein
MKFFRTLTTLLLLATVSARAADPVTLHWLGGTAPAAPIGVSWGVPWPKGAVQTNTPMRLATASGARLDLQTWPVAYWPDGSVKWSGHAIAAAPGLAGPLTLTPLANADSAPATTIKYSEDANAFTIDTGIVRARIAKHLWTFIESLAVGSRVVAQNGRLIAMSEECNEPDERRDIGLVGIMEKVTLEQSGPIRAVIKLEGRHVESVHNGRVRLPFTVRLYFFAGSGAIKLTHSFVFDSDGNKDFLKGLGLSFEIPFAEEPHNRHIRFVGDSSAEPDLVSDTGVWAQPVRMLPGYRPQAGRATSLASACRTSPTSMPAPAKTSSPSPSGPTPSSPKSVRIIFLFSNAPLPKPRGSTSPTAIARRASPFSPMSPAASPSA